MRTLVMAYANFVFSTAAARADQFWIAYEANQNHTPPELQGWQHHWDYGEPPTPPVRSVLNGIFTLDTLGLWHVEDFNYRNAAVSLDAGEQFVAEYRVRVTGDIHDTWVFVSQGSSWGSDIGMTIGPAQIAVGATTIEITSGVFHQYRWTSNDMIQFDLYIDGVLRHSRSRTDELGPSVNMLFGDWTFGTAPGAPTSRSEWDYVRFGVVPEPVTALSLIVAFAALIRRRNSPV